LKASVDLVTDYARNHEYGRFNCSQAERCRDSAVRMGNLFAIDIETANRPIEATHAVDAPLCASGAFKQ
jgi:hypothetical protein